MPGFPVFGTGQPTLSGFDKVLEPILKKYGDEKIIYWANLRQEPVVYVNGNPYTARDPARFFYYILVSNSYDKIKQKYPSFNVYKTQSYVYIFCTEIILNTTFYSLQ